MKKFKTALTILLAGTMILSAGAGTFAASQVDNKDIPQIAICPEGPVRSVLEGNAVVKSINENKQITVTIEDQTIVLNISEETIFIDSQTGIVSSIKDIKEGDSIYIYYSAAMTRSLPAQSSAKAVVTNVQKDKTIPKMMVVKEIMSSDKDQIKILNDCEDMIVTITKENPILPYKTKQIVTLDNIKVGSQIFVWYDIVAMSYPGQTTSHKTVIVGTQEIKAPEKLQIDGKVLDLGKEKIMVKNGKVMLPLRTVSKAMGFELKWNSETNSAEIDNGEVKTSVTVGVDSYYKASSKAIGLTAPFEYGVSPEIVDGSLYIPAELFKLLFSNENAVKIQDNILNITTK